MNPHMTPGGPDGAASGQHGYQHSGNMSLHHFGSFMSEQKSEAIYQQVSIINDGGVLDSFSSGIPMNPNASNSYNNKNNNNNNNNSDNKNDDEKKQDNGGGGGLSGLPKFGNSNSNNNMINSSPSDVGFGDKLIKKESTNVGNEGYSSAQSPNALYVVKANFDYPGGYRTQELTFSRGMVLLVTAEAEGWLFGCYESDISKHGWFPESYVTKM